MGVPHVESSPKPTSGPTRPSAKEKQDDMIMNTNNSCIVSKRSVEKIYHKDDAGFLRHFVSRFQRRSPLINRGYWLRMRAIEHVVRKFLQSDTHKPKAVVNLGCGYDTLPFKFLAKHRDTCQDARFIDVDYRQLIRKKCQVIKETKALSDIIPDATTPDVATQCIHLQSAHYTAASADLQSQTDLKTLQQAASLDNHAVLLIAEVSVTYMNQKAADAMIRWANGLCDAQFCLLEQFLPEGADSAFARTMLKHFEKLNSPLKSAIHYPLLADQRQRFSAQGWPDVRASSLWSLWYHNEFLSADDRRQIDAIEPFDEWEEFIMFASHYFVLIARQQQHEVELLPGLKDDPTDVKVGDQCERLRARFEPLAKRDGQRRYGASTQLGNNMALIHGGHGAKGRLSSTEAYTRLESPGEPFDLLLDCPSTELMCHTITRLKSGAYLMVGGRASPDRASRACFLYEAGEGWHPTDELPDGRYRHCAVALDDGLLILGGKHDSCRIAQDHLYWQQGRGWRTVRSQGHPQLPAFFGAAAKALSETAMLIDGSTFAAVVCGGMTDSGTTQTGIWGLDLPQERPDGTLRMQSTKIELADEADGRFGARIIEVADGLLLIGGCPSRGLGCGAELLHLDREFRARPMSIQLSPGCEGARPMLVGHAVEHLEAIKEAVVIGGGAVCFSFGTVWNQGLYALQFTDNDSPQTPKWKIVQAQDECSGVAKASEPCESPGEQNFTARKSFPVRRLAWAGNADDFRRILETGKPVILEDVNFGACRDRWSLHYLKNKIGHDRMVTVHESSSAQMSFLDKNFTYVKKKFGEFIDGVLEGRLEYLRAISSTRPTSEATDLKQDFPGIAADFTLPAELGLITERAHSSVLRISGPVKMWLHYDVMANVLCQVRGSKQLVLYAPEDGDQLGFPAGASSSRSDPFDMEQRARAPLCNAQAHLAQLREGDVLFIPALWAHTAAPGDGTSIAVNVFFRDLDSGYAAGKDVYGNRDLAAYEQGRRDLAKVIGAFDGLPAAARKFYLGRLAGELRAAKASRDQG